jgi:hypothetical protein
VIAAFVVVIAQSCAALLPPPTVQIDWSRNGQPYARDVPVSSNSTERVYRRSFRNGTSEDVTRVLSCAPSQQGAVLSERLGGEDVSIPIELRRAQSMTLNGATIRRIDPPSDAAAGSLWFSVSRYGPQLFALRDRVGIEEIRTPALSGRVEILRAVLTSVEPNRPVGPGLDEQSRLLSGQLAERERMNVVLADSIIALLRTIEAERREARRSGDALSSRSAVASTSLAVRAAQLIADSASNLPSADAAFAWGWAWPGAGHGELNRDGTAWIAAGVLSLGAVAAGTVGTGLSDEVRIGAIAGGAAAYALSLFISHRLLDLAIAEESAAGRTRESFLRSASVSVTSSGDVSITLRKPVR